MTSYQKLKTKCQELQNQVNIFKNALTIARAEPKFEFNKDGKCFATSAYQIIENKIEYEAQVKLTHWVIKNIDRKIIKEWLESKTRFIKQRQREENNKLGQIEDIEQELGIDLITLFKIIKGQKIYVKKLDKYLQCDFGVRNYGRDYVFIHRHGVVNTRCYKKTWALDKQTLEK